MCSPDGGPSGLVVRGMKCGDGGDRESLPRQEGDRRMHEHHHVDVQHYIREIEAFRREKDDFFAMSPESPIPDAERERFHGLRYYPPDLAFRVEATLIPFDQPQIVTLGSTQGDLREQLRYGELRFSIIGQDCRLTAFKDAGDPHATSLFIPFRDATSGGETYGAGRYIEAEDDQTSSGPRTVIVDFNLAYSPWCAYSAAYSCTLPPPENRLSIAIIAGELLYPIDVVH